MKINMNNNVKVKLTEYGINELRRQFNELMQKHNLNWEFREPDKDSEGYTTYQLHYLMATFGHCFQDLGRQPHLYPFDTNLIIEC